MLPLLPPESIQAHGYTKGNVREKESESETGTTAEEMASIHLINIDVSMLLAVLQALETQEYRAASAITTQCFPRWIMRADTLVEVTVTPTD